MSFNGASKLGPIFPERRGVVITPWGDKVRLTTGEFVHERRVGTSRVRVYEDGRILTIENAYPDTPDFFGIGAQAKRVVCSYCGGVGSADRCEGCGANKKEIEP